MGIVGIHPAVFVRVASTGVTGYGTWKSAQRIENKGFGKRPFCGAVGRGPLWSSSKTLGMEVLPPIPPGHLQGYQTKGFVEEGICK